MFQTQSVHPAQEEIYLATDDAFRHGLEEMKRWAHTKATVIMPCTAKGTIHQHFFSKEELFGEVEPTVLSPSCINTHEFF